VVTYLDHAATAPLRPEAAAAVLDQLGRPGGNPTGAHALARASRQVVDEARDVVADCLGCRASEVVFTSGGTEADNLAVSGTVAGGGGTAVCSAVEHHAVLHPVAALAGAVAPVHPDGTVDLGGLAEVLQRAPRPVALVSVMLVNNETGMIQPLEAVAEVVARHAPEAVLHTDAVQAVPWLDAGATAPAGLVSVSAHKLGGPQGVGALVVREGTSLRPQLLGGGQERERRSGTHNVAGIAGFAAALAATVAERAATVARVAALRDRLADGLLAAVPGSRETGRRDGKVAGSCHLLLDRVESEALLVLLDRQGVCASAASSCASGALEPSHVLAAMGVSRVEARGALRLSLGATTTGADVDHALEVIPPAVGRLRQRDPLLPRPVAAVGAP
jgi:cysteine desulfurase